MSLENFKQSVIALIFIALIIGGIVLALDAFQNDLESTGVCTNASSLFNTTTGLCQENGTSLAVGGAIGSTNYQYNISQEGIEGVANATSYLSTIGTLIGVAALIAIVIGAFMFIRK
jgi:hypothetical protein